MNNTLIALLNEYEQLGIDKQVDYHKFYLYSLITHSTAIEGSTVTEIENQLLFDEGIAAAGRPMVEQLMNIDLKGAYDHALRLATAKEPVSVPMLCQLSALVMKNTGSTYSTLQGSFDSSKGELRKVNVTAGVGGRSYVNHLKVKTYLEDFCKTLNERMSQLDGSTDVEAQYLLSFDAHYQLVTIHPWVDGNGRMARLLMNYLQFVFGLVPARIDKAHKAEYIAALIASREQESLAPFRCFMMKEHTANLEKEIATFKQSTNHNPLNDRTK